MNRLALARLSGLGLAASLVTFNLSAHAVSRYEVQLIDVGSNAYFTPQALNDQGLIIGTVNSGQQGSATRTAAAWSGGAWQAITHVDGGFYVEPRGVNNAGQVVGSDGGLAFIWQAGSTQKLSALGPPSGASAINDAGVAVGQDGSQAIQWTNGTAQTLQRPAHLSSAQAQGINESGLIVGFGRLPGSAEAPTVALRWQGEQVSQLAQGDAIQAQAMAVNEAGTVIGHAQFADGSEKAARWDGDSLSWLAQLSPQTTSRALGINDAGLIVGQSKIWLDLAQGTFLSRATLWEGTLAHDLSDWVDNGEGWTLSAAMGINASGQIVGVGLYQGKRAGFILSPVPEPSSLWMLGIGIAFVGMAGRHRASRQR